MDFCFVNMWTQGDDSGRVRSLSLAWSHPSRLSFLCLSEFCPEESGRRFSLRWRLHGISLEEEREGILLGEQDVKAQNWKEIGRTLGQ